MALTAASQAVLAPSDDEYHSLSGHEPEDGGDDEDSDALEPPVHPVPSMQAAFEESIIESADGKQALRRSLHLDAEGRRQRLLESKRYNDSWNARWRQRATAQHHPLLKVMAQIIFGMHLLQQRQAKSEEEVVKILQTHVNELDRFLERTGEDFSLAIKDIDERIRFLKLPMKHLDVFDIMLDDKKFRTQLLDGNDKIERIIDRTAKAMNAALTDVHKGLEAVKELGKYLNSTRAAWPQDYRAIFDVYGAMRGNEQGWKSYLKDLQAKGRDLGAHLVQLGKTIGEMSRLAAAASRRNKAQSKAIAKSAPSSPGLRSKFNPDSMPTTIPTPATRPGSNLDKPLPQEPTNTTSRRQYQQRQAVKQPAMSKPHPVPFAERYERPRESPRQPQTQGPSPVATVEPPRPRTADPTVRRREARAADERQNTLGLVAFLKDRNPLGSNPPEMRLNQTETAVSARKPYRSSSQGANALLEDTALARKIRVRRSMSLSAVEGLRPAEKAHDSPVLALPLIRESEKSAVHAPSDAGQVEKGAEDAAQRTGFARRLSKRLKHHMQVLPTPEQPSNEEIESWRKPSSEFRTSEAGSPRLNQQHSPPIDSVYGSRTSTDKIRPPPYEPPHASSSPATKSIDIFQARAGAMNELRPKISSETATGFDTKKTNETRDERTVGRLQRDPSVRSLASKTGGRNLGSMKRFFRSRNLSKLFT